MAYTSLAEYEQHVSDKALLGRIVLFCQHEATMRHDDVVDNLKALGLEDYAPRRPSDSDVFRRVASAAQRKRIPVNDVYFNILVRDLTTSGDELTKHVFTETVDQKGKRIDFRADWEVVYHRPSGTVGRKPLPTHEFGGPSDLASAEIVDNYQRTTGMVDGNCLRTVVTRILDKNHGINARPTGGAAFVLERHAWIVPKLEAFAKKTTGCWVHGIPLPDDDEQRPYVQEQATAAVLGDIDSTLTEMRGLLESDGDVSARAFASIKNRFVSLTELASDYEELLADKLDDTKSRLQLMESVMINIARKVA